MLKFASLARALALPVIAAALLGNAAVAQAKPQHAAHASSAAAAHGAKHKVKHHAGKKAGKAAKHGKKARHAKTGHALR